MFPKPNVGFAAVVAPKPKELAVLVCPKTEVFAADVVVPNGFAAAGVPNVLVAADRRHLNLTDILEMLRNLDMP